MELSVICNSLLLVLTSILFVIYLWAKHNADYWKRHGIPHKNILPLFGNFFGIVIGKQGVIDIFNELYNESEESPICGTNIFHKPCLVIKNPELIKLMLIKDFNLFTNRYAGSNLSHDKIGGNVLLFLKGTKWKTLRNKLTPSFSSAKLKQMFYLKSEVGNELRNVIKDNNDGGNSEIDVYDVVGRYTTDVIATCAFGVKANSLRNPDSEFRTHGKQIIDTKSTYRAFSLLATFLVPQANNLFRFNVLSKETNNFFRLTIPQVMDERQKNGIVRNDLLDTLILFRKQHQDEKLQNVKYHQNDIVFHDDLLIAQSVMFFAAGFETSSSAVAFCLYELAKNPDIQEKVRAEIKTALDKNGGNITYDLIDGLQYTHQVLSETLRMYPPLTNLDRMFEAPDKTSKYSLAPHHNFEIPHGMPILIPVHSIHRDPKYFPEPTKFDPDRFLDKSIYTNGSYVPFGLGPRKCIADRFGLIQSKVALVNILKDNFVTPSDKTPSIMKFDRKALAIKSEGGLLINIMPEKHSK